MGEPKEDTLDQAGTMYEPRATACPHCRKQLSLFHVIWGMNFCSPEHRGAYLSDLDARILARLRLEAKHRTMQQPKLTNLGAPRQPRALVPDTRLPRHTGILESSTTAFVEAGHGNMQTRERRREVRFQKRAEVSLVWEDSRGELQYKVTTTCDLSRSGIRVHVREPIDRNSFMRVRADSLKLNGTAVVRYSARKGGASWIGLEFSGGMKLDPLLMFELPAMTVIN